MKRIQLILVVAAVMAAMLAALPGPAMARDNDRGDNDRADRVDNRLENRIDRFEDRYNVDLDDKDVFYYPYYPSFYYPYYYDDEDCWEYSWVFEEWQWDCD